MSGAAPAVVFEDSVLSYAELNANANRLARQLVTHGVGPDVLVAIAIPRSPALVVAVLAVLKAGGAYLPLDPHYPAERLAHMVTDARPALLLRTQDTPAAHLDVPEAVLDAPAFAAQCARHGGADLTADERLAPLTVDHLMYVIYTSGSTGVPKGVAVNHTGVADLVATQARQYGAGPGERVLQWASFSFDAWFWDFALGLLHGATLVMAAQEDLMPGEALRATLLRHRVDHAVLPPVALAATDSTGLLVGGTVTSTGDVCTTSLARQWSQGRRLFNGYGPTEVTVGASIGGPVTGVQDEVSIGTPWIGSTVHVLDDHLSPVPEGVEGELFLAGSGMARGYLNRPGLTATRFVADPYGPPGSRMYRSGDRGRQDADGKLYFTGRADQQVKVRGFRIELGEIEARLETHPAIVTAVAVVTGAEVSTEHVVAFVTATAPGDLDAGQVREHARGTLPEHMVPSRIVAVEEFPATPNGKIDRAALADRAAARTAATPLRPDASAAPDDGSVEQRLCALVRETLQVAAVGPQDNFFDLGGHSVLAAKLAGRIRTDLGASVPMRTVFSAPTLADLARALQEAPAA
ncbi:amino acid adenylation domain-containing protein [Streptomyces sp. NPDC087440]|uniref:non-ribosomal peptide synthetase n=1 Tax=Streptomyces sp. NPDC087440 TaxID=3365790 RepID=UPI003818EC5F